MAVRKKTCVGVVSPARPDSVLSAKGNADGNYGEAASALLPFLSRPVDGVKRKLAIISPAASGAYLSIL